MAGRRLLLTMKRKIRVCVYIGGELGCFRNPGSVVNLLICPFITPKPKPIRIFGMKMDGLTCSMVDAKLEQIKFELNKFKFEFGLR